MAKNDTHDRWGARAIRLLACASFAWALLVPAPALAQAPAPISPVEAAPPPAPAEPTKPAEPAQPADPAAPEPEAPSEPNTEAAPGEQAPEATSPSEGEAPPADANPADATREQPAASASAETPPPPSAAPPPAAAAPSSFFSGTAPLINQQPVPVNEPEPTEMWGAVEPGKGFLVGRTDWGQLSISAYALVRYLNQLPADQTYVDHLGREHVVDTRNDIYAHRVMVFLKGWLGLPKLTYNIILWTVNTTDQDAMFATLGYQLHRSFNLYAGLNGLPGTRSLQGSHPYWLGHDRVMADEFFRPFFTNGAWVNGEPLPGLWYTLMVGNNLSALGVTAKQLTRDLATAGSIWWMPTTTEFGPQGAFGDFEMHDKIATRFGVSATRSREDRFSNVATNAPDNTTIRLADSLNLFDPGSLATDVTVQLANYRLVALDAGIKYRGFFLQAEYYNRWLNGFDADGPLPVSSIHDTGFYVQAAFFPLPRLLEVYAATSQIFGDKSAGFGHSYEVLGGANYYVADSRNIRLNLQAIGVHRSPVSSSFGYYVGGQEGLTISAAFSIFF